MAAKVQFSLRMIFVVTAVVAVFAAEAVAFSEWMADTLGFAISCLLPPVFVAQIVYARGIGRAFGIGALSVWLAVTSWIFIFGLIYAGVAAFEVFGGGVDFCLFWLLTLAGGGVAVLVRWMSVSQPPQ